MGVPAPQDTVLKLARWLWVFLIIFLVDKNEPYEVIRAGVMTPILQIINSSVREVKWLCPGSCSSWCPSWNTDPDLSSSHPLLHLAASSHLWWEASSNLPRKDELYFYRKLSFFFSFLKLKYSWQILYAILYMWNLKTNTSESIYKIKTDSQTQKTNLRLCKGEREA